ncbi:MAG: MFS transporter [Puniceicoccales bacterium]|jgi:predicted MFS family arabinose efflux permease|nr:MFS transporter [Puniceicoccales bacterium]
MFGSLPKNFSQTDAAKKTFLFDNCRCFCSGIVEAAFKAFALIIAIRFFNASKTAKSLISSAGFLGYFVAIVTQSIAAKQRRFKTMDLAKMYLLIVAILIFMAALVSSLGAFMALMVAAMIFFKQPVPLMEDVYGQNYSPNERGSRLAFALMVLPLSTAIFSAIGGKSLDLHLKNYRPIFAIVALAAVGSAVSFSKIPSRLLPAQKKKSVLSNFKIIFQDKLFGKILLWWSFAGIANQMVNPLRTEYLVNRDYGINASNLFETFACLIIPLSFRIVSTLSWGRLFDRSKIITVKLLVNSFMVIGFLLFFHTKAKWVISFAAIFAGIAWGGGEIVWCLWVTKIVPKESLSMYMGVNVAIVGLRGFLAPFIGYGLSHYFTLQQVSWIATSMVLVSSIGLFTLRKYPRFDRIK